MPAAIEHDPTPDPSALVPLVKRLARQLIGRLPASVGFDDIVQAGMIGLMDAMKRFDCSCGAELTTFATQRIRGAMLDELRSGDWAPRELRRAQRAVVDARARLEQTLGRAPREHEIANALDLSLQDYHRVVLAAASARLLSLEEAGIDDDESFIWDFSEASAGPSDKLERSQLAEALAQARGLLPEREARVLALYYDQELPFREIAALLGVTVSRICQIHRQAIERLRRALGEWHDAAPTPLDNRSRMRVTEAGCPLQ